MARVAFLLNNDFLFDARVYREARSLTENGHAVTVFCVANQAKNLPVKEQHGALSIHRVIRKPLPTFHPFSPNQLSALLRISGASGSFDVVHAHDSNTLLLGWVLARLWKAKLVYDSHELWSSIFQFEREQALQCLKKAKLTRKLSNLNRVTKLEQWLLPRCDAIISVNDTLCQRLAEQAKDLTIQTVSLRNIPGYFSLDHVERGRFHTHFNLPPDTRIMLYQGDIKPTRGIEELLLAMERLSIPNLSLVLMGPIPDANYAQQLKQRIQTSSALSGRVFHKERVASAELLNWTASADLGIAPILNARESYYYCLPNKLFEYIQAGVPCATSNFPEMRKVVEGYHIGFTFDPENTGEMVKKLTDFFTSPALTEQYTKHISTAKTELCWENEQKKLLTLYQNLWAEGS